MVSPADHQKQPLFDLDGILADRVLSRRLFDAGYFIGDLAHDTGETSKPLRAGAYPIIMDDMMTGESFRSWMGIPLRSNGAFLGGVFLWHSTPGFFQGADLYPVTAIAEILAVARHNNQHFRRTVSELETDRLTGLLTRTGFERDAERLLRTSSEQYSINAIAMMDIDLFKQVNDRYGHIAGDSVNSAFAEAVQANLRHDDLIAHSGGEEFVGISESITVSIGVAICGAAQAGRKESRRDCRASRIATDQ